MKKLIAIALLLSSFGVMAQSKKKQSAQDTLTIHLNDVQKDWWARDKISSTTTTTTTTGLTLISTPKLNYSWILIGNGSIKPMLTLDRYPQGGDKPIERVTIHVKRSNTVWVNDSTLVVKP